MSKVLIVGGGAAGMFASIFAAKMAMKSTYLRKMKNLERSFSSREKADAMSPMPVTWMNFSRIWYPMRNSCTAVFTDLPTRM